MIAVKFKTIAPFQVITGFGDPIYDPEGSKKHAETQLRSTPEWQQFVLLLRDYNQPGSASQLAPFIQKLSVRLNYLLDKYPVYFYVPGEVNMLDPEPLRSKFHALKANELLTLNGQVILDNRDRVSWKKDVLGWVCLGAITEVDTDKPEGAVWEEDLSHSQVEEIKAQWERERIAELTDEDRAIEKQVLVNAARGEAAFMRSELEIEGHDNALEASRAWYRREVERIEDRYKR